MILTDEGLMDWGRMGGIEPFDERNINATSVDFCWSGNFRRPIKHDWHGRDPLDFAIVDNPNPLPRWGEVEHAEYLMILPNEFYLLDTLEYITMPDDCAGLLLLKSSWGRAGAEHLHAGLFEPQFHGTGTLEIVNLHPSPVTLKKGDRFVQLMLVKTDGLPSIVPYSKVGRYSGQSLPEPSKPMVQGDRG